MFDVRRVLCVVNVDGEEISVSVDLSVPRWWDRSREEMEKKWNKTAQQTQSGFVMKFLFLLMNTRSAFSWNISINLSWSNVMGVKVWMTWWGWKNSWKLMVSAIRIHLYHGNEVKARPWFYSSLPQPGFAIKLFEPFEASLIRHY